jgi:hypothetical protein
LPAWAFDDACLFYFYILCNAMNYNISTRKRL